MMNVNALTPSPFRPQFLLPPTGHQAPVSPGSQRSATLPTPETSRPAPAPSLGTAASTSLKRELADKQNLKTLGQKVSDTATRLGVNATPQAILAALKATPMDIQPGSSYPIEAGTAVTLDTYLTSSGLFLPNSHFALTALADAVFNRAMEHPLGNFGGGLSWPLPLGAAGQRTLVNTANDYAARRPNPPQMGPSLGILEYVSANQPPSGDAITDPAKALVDILNNPRAQGLGQAIQTQLNGIATDTSVNDYALTAINLVLDPESIDHPTPNRVAGFNLDQQSHWGKPASDVAVKLSEHLSHEGKTTADMANVGAYLLLARKAPELLIKDIPASVTYGSPAWLNLSIAAATIEAQTPGKVPNMTFAQVMSAAENANLQDLSITRGAQSAALRVWGVVNGVISQEEADRYNSADIDKVKTDFNQQANERIEASSLIQTEMPSRKEIALAKLKERFGQGVPFEEKLLTVNDTVQPHAQPLYDPNRAPAGRLSLLDIAMSGLDQFKWETKDPRILEATQGKSLKLDVNAAFNDQLTRAIDLRKKGIGTTIKHLIAQLPVADRHNLEYGKLEFYQNNTYQLGAGFTGKTLVHKNEQLLVKATGTTGETVYAIDLKKGSISTVPGTVLTRERERDANRVYPIERFTPSNASEADWRQDTTAGTSRPVPSSFSSTRTQSIADAFVEHLDIDNKDAITQGKGTTAYDQQMDVEERLADFFLDLVPLRSAIVNFKNGNYMDGALDLGMDIFGFVTAGVGTAAKVAKVGAKAIRTTTKALQVARILGTTVIGELNPVSGLGDLIQGGAKLIGKGVDKVRNANGAYEAARAVSSEHGPITHGTFKVADQTFQSDTILSNGHRYAYDSGSMKAYGTPLEDFNPVDTLAPTSPFIQSPRQHAHRYNPMNPSGRPPVRVRAPLPEGDYAESMRGRLEPDHFKPDTKMKTMQKFNSEMNDYYDAIKQVGLPTRPSIPSVPKPVTVPELLTEALNVSNGVVLGESHKQMASFRVLFDNVDTLTSQGVKKVYFEGLIDMPQGLQDDGIGILGHTKLPRTNPTFEELRKKLGDNGIEVLPLDHYYLTRHKDLRGLREPTTTGAGSIKRLEEFNYYAAETIQANSGNEKWVALVGHSHMNTSEGVPGLAELTGSIGIGVFDNPKIPDNIGTRVLGHAQDPSKPVGSGGIPGDLQIYMKP
jgi:hypothetical protein